MGGSADVCASISIEYRNFAFALLFGLLIFFIITSTIIAHKHITVIHCAMPTLLLAILISYLISLTSNKSIITNAVSNDFIYKYLLPIIVLTEGFNMKNRSVQTYSRENTVLGIVVPLFIIICNSALLYGVQKLAFSVATVDEAYYLSTPVLMSLSITMNNVDLHGSIAPLMTIKNMRLYKILFSSALLSNNMCLVFVMTFERMLVAGSFGTDTFIPDFFKVGAFSIFMGLLIGGIVSLIMKNSPSLSKNPIYETLFVIIGAYLSYCLAHLSFFQLSGDVAIFFYGIMMAHYNKYNMSAESFRNIGLTFNLLLQFAEAICFIYIGLSFQDAVLGHPLNFGFAGILVLILLITRTIVISIAAAICGFWTEGFRVRGKEWGAVVLAGMVRGPMSYIFANVLVPVRSCLDVKNYFQYAKAFPLFIMQIAVVFSIVVMIPLNFVFFHIFIKKQVGEGEDVLEEKIEHEEIKKELLQGDWRIDHKNPRVFRYVDEYYLKPMLIRDYLCRKVQIEELKQKYDSIAGLYDHGVHLEHELHHENMHITERHKRAKKAAMEIKKKEFELKRKAFWRGIWEDHTNEGRAWKEEQKKLDPTFKSSFEKWNITIANAEAKAKGIDPAKI
jgi:NhaP-type Na+/H+ or K+/H+ antiporter